MISKHLYAYGHTLSFYSTRKQRECNTIYIDCLHTLSLKQYTHKIFFDTNQGREIYLCSQYDLNEKQDKWAFVVEGCITFLCNTETKTICYKEEQNFSQELMEYWLVHIVLPLFLTLENKHYFFHTGSVLVEDKAVLFMGDSYAGKSTLTDFFLQKGHALLSDDKLASFYDEQSEAFFVHASHPYHRPYRAREDLGQKAENFKEGRFSIGKIYWLEPVAAEKEVSIKELKGRKKFECLRYSTEMDIALYKRERFEYLSKFANSMKIYEVQVPHDMKRLGEVYEKIVEDIKKEER